ncbi:MAG: hypothetical protein Kow0090_16280 [Myxococcota bacterium]
MMEGEYNTRHPTMPVAQVGKYRLIEEVGQGAMATVFKAHDEILDRVVALKLLHQHLIGKDEVRRRFAREARAVARLKHPNIVEIFDASTVSNAECFIVTEFVYGYTLKQFFDKFKHPLPEIPVMMVMSLLSALTHAHSLGIIHRDIKPENVMVSRDGEIKLMDFGIAQMVDSTGRLTMTGALMGSPAYMSPEQIEGGAVDSRADIYSLGIMLYELLTGDLPFKGDNAASLLKNILEANYAKPSKLSPHIDRRLNEIIERAMERDVQNRFPTSQSFYDALSDWLESSGIQDHKETLKNYLKNPSQEYQKFLNTVILNLTESAEEEIKRKNAPYAIDLLNRVLALAPGDSSVERKIQRLLARRKWRSAMNYGAATACALLLVVIVGWFMWERWKSTPISAAPEIEAETFSEPELKKYFPFQKEALSIEALFGLGDESATNEKKLAGKSNQESSKNAGAVKNSLEGEEQAASTKESAIEDPMNFEGPPRKVIFRLNTWAKVEIDGEELSDPPRQVHELEIQPGNHTIAFINPSYSKLVKEVFVPPAGEIMPYVFKLKAAPARLYVHNSQNADIILDGHFASSSADSLKIPLVVEMREEQTKRDVRVQLFKESFMPYEQVIELKAGEEKHIYIDLKPIKENVQ